MATLTVTFTANSQAGAQMRRLAKAIELAVAQCPTTRARAPRTRLAPARPS
jgi:hypothetical protein